VIPVAVLALPQRIEFMAGTPATAAEVNANFEALWTELAATTAQVATLQTELTTATAEIATLQTELTAAQNPDCPEGYTRDATRTDIVLCKKGADEMVKVGDFWVDRYEASVWSKEDCTGTQYGAGGTDDYPTGFPDTGQWSTKLYACSKVGVVPSRMLTWFQAQQACGLSGKHLIRNDEWQMAAAGTFDVGANDGLANQNCNTSSSGPRETGQAGTTPGVTCISRSGAEDMVGNLWEWTAEWWQAGQTWQTADGETQCPSGCTGTGGWPSGYGADVTCNLNGRVLINGVAWMPGVPAAALRGGTWGNGTLAGVFAVDLNHGPSSWSPANGVRCARRR
jgi:formylglycine-generating enzyme required for sulfatase activity